jgi:hypothetical protein
MVDSSMPYDQTTAERVRDLLSKRHNAVEKQLMGGLCFMVCGNMCCSVSAKGGLLIRVGPAAHARALREPHVSAMKMGGRTMKGFVRVAPEGYRTDAALAAWIGRSLDFVATLPAKSPRGRAPSKPPRGRRQK